MKRKIYLIKNNHIPMYACAIEVNSRSIDATRCMVKGGIHTQYASLRVNRTIRGNKENNSKINFVCFAF